MSHKFDYYSGRFKDTLSMAGTDTRLSRPDYIRLLEFVVEEAQCLLDAARETQTGDDDQ